jgi:enolase
MSEITSVVASIIKDSRNCETLSVSVFCGEKNATFSVPSGASTGIHEAHELRDSDGKGVSLALNAVNNIIAPKIIGLDVTKQKEIDEILCNLDPDKQKGTLGANSILGVSGAVARLGAVVSGMPLFEYLRKTFSDVTLGGYSYPHSYFNLINGGKHAHTDLAFQEYHIVPRCGSTKDDLICAIDIYNALREKIENEYPGTIMGDEGGYALDVSSVELPLSILKEIVKQKGYEDKVSYALDVAASSFFEGNFYEYDSKAHTEEELASLYESMSKEQKFISIEDPFAEESFPSFSSLRKSLPDVKIIGDDLTVTNTLRLQKAIEENAIDGLIIKPNQIGTISETVEAINLAHKNNLVCIISHRSGETMDDTIADIVRAFECFGLKSGAPGPKERMVKYERLVSITS